MQRNNGAPACASCRHQRKKCTNKCVLAPFFPANKSQEFHAVHKVFGVSNATKIVMSVNKEEDRRRVVESLIWEAKGWQKDPVQGPYGEHKKVYEELRLYRTLYNHVPPQSVYKSATSLSGGFNNNVGMNYINNNGSAITDSCEYDYSTLQSMEKIRQDNSGLILPQQRPINGFNQSIQSYYLPGQYSALDAKEMESAL